MWVSSSGQKWVRHALNHNFVKFQYCNVNILLAMEITNVFLKTFFKKIKIYRVFHFNNCWGLLYEIEIPCIFWRNIKIENRNKKNRLVQEYFVQYWNVNKYLIYTLLLQNPLHFENTLIDYLKMCFYRKFKQHDFMTRQPLKCKNLSYLTIFFMTCVNILWYYK